MEDRRNKAHGNAAQMRAITHVSGPAVVLAGPGSGKTFVIAERVKTLIERGGAVPSEILTITFTRAAAAEMRGRFLRLSDGKYPEVNFGTFHSIFYQILKLSHKNYLDHAPNIITETEKRRIASLLIADASRADPGVSKNMELGSIWLSEISRLKSEGLRADEARESLPYRELFSEFYAGYARMLKELNRLDFDDILNECLDMLKNDENALKLWQRKFKFILIDEYQDINRVQFEAVKLLALPENNLFVVGDDDQSIYGFRGSRPDIMLNFERDYPGAKKIFLDVNYRCAEKIITASSLLIKENKTRFDKVTKAGRNIEDAVVEIREFSSRDEEIESMAAFLSRCDKPGDAAVIVRTNVQATRVSEKLAALEIRVNHRGKVKNPYEHKAVLDILSYLRLAGRSPDTSDLFRVMNRPLRYLSRECARGGLVDLDEIVRYYRDRPEMKAQAVSFVKSIRMIGGMRPALSIRYIRKQLKYDSFVRTSGEYPEPDEALTLLDRLQEEAGDFSSNDAFLKHVAEKKESVESKMTNSSFKKDINSVNILTMHAAKGLEFDSVWLPELNEGTIPSKKLVSEEQLEEERRLLYVAMTRAKKSLIMSFLSGDEGYSYVPSRFLRPVMMKPQEVVKK